MDLRTLSYFTATVDSGSVSAAGDLVHVTQPALSRQLRGLERGLGITLFDRQSGRLVLSAAGEQFLPLARDLLARAAAAERAAAALAAGRLTTVRLAVPTTTLTDVLAPFLATLGPDDPVAIVRELDPPEAANSLRAGSDLAIVTRPPSAELASRPLAALPIWAYVRPDDEWAGREAVTIADLAGRTLVVMTPDFKPRALLDAAFEAAARPYGDIIECTNAQVALALAASGRGVAVVSDDPRFDLVGARVIGPHGPVLIQLYAAWNPKHHGAGVLASLADRLADYCITRFGPGVGVE